MRGNSPVQFLEDLPPETGVGYSRFTSKIALNGKKVSKLLNQKKQKKEPMLWSRIQTFSRPDSARIGLSTLLQISKVLIARLRAEPLQEPGMQLLKKKKMMMDLNLSENLDALSE